MKLRWGWIAGFLVGATGCAYQLKVSPTPGVGPFPATVTADVVADPPSGATQVGDVVARGNNWQTPASCEAQLIVGARRLGGTHLVPTPAEAGGGKGPRCTATVYRVAP